MNKWKSSFVNTPTRTFVFAAPSRPLGSGGSQSRHRRFALPPSSSTITDLNMEKKKRVYVPYKKTRSIKFGIDVRHDVPNVTDTS